MCFFFFSGECGHRCWCLKFDSQQQLWLVRASPPKNLSFFCNWADKCIFFYVLFIYVFLGVSQDMLAAFEAIQGKFRQIQTLTTKQKHHLKRFHGSYDNSNGKIDSSFAQSKLKCCSWNFILISCNGCDCELSCIGHKIILFVNVTSADECISFCSL